MIPTSTDCYSCHAAHAAVDTTFVQFYPTLLPIATSKGTLSAAYQKEIASPVQEVEAIGFPPIALCFPEGNRTVPGQGR